MSEPSVPAAFAMIAADPSDAADAAVATAFPHLCDAAQVLAIDMLIERGHTPSLASVVGEYAYVSKSSRAHLRQHASALSGAVRVAIASNMLRERLSAIAMVRQSNRADFAYLLAGALTLDCARTRKNAAEVLVQLTASAMDDAKVTPEGRSSQDGNDTLDRIAEGLRAAVMSWDLHRREDVLAAALRCFDEVEPAIRRKLIDRRTGIVEAIRGLLDNVSDPRMAACVWRVLTIESLRVAAGRAICRAKAVPFRRAIIAQSARLPDRALEKACRKLRPPDWIVDVLTEVKHADARFIGSAIRLLSRMGQTDDHKVALYRRLMDFGTEAVHQAMLGQLIKDMSAGAEEILTLMAARRSGEVSRSAARELRRRNEKRTGAVAIEPDQVEPGPNAAFDRYWQQVDDATPKERTEMLDVLRPYAVSFLPRLRAKLAHSAALERVRALETASRLGIVAKLDEQVYRLAHDGDPIVRSAAVSLLAELPTTVSLRLLRLAVDDLDTRVQANAIEALDRLDSPDRISVTEPKLACEHHRVRANAVKSLLRSGSSAAGDVLLDMFEAPDAAWRLSALWVVDRLRLEAVGHRIARISRDDPNPHVRARAKLVLKALSPLDPVSRKPHRAKPEEITA